MNNDSKQLNLEKNNLKNFIKIVSQKSFDEIVFDKVFNLVKNNEQKFIGISSFIKLDNILEKFLKKQNDKIFEKINFAILSEIIIKNKNSKYLNLMNDFFEKLNIDAENVIAPIKSWEEKKAKKEVLNFSKQIEVKKGFDLILINYDFDENKLELINLNYFSKNQSQKSFTFIEGEAQKASIGLSEIIGAKELVVLVNSKKNYDLELKNVFENKKIDDNIFLNFLSKNSNKTNFYFIQNNLNPNLKKVEQTLIKESKKALLKDLNEKNLVEFPKNRKTSVFYDDNFLDDKKKLLEYQEELKQKIFDVSEKVDLLKKVINNSKALDLKNPTVKIQAKVLKNIDSK